MKIDCVIGSRADKNGMLAIHGCLPQDVRNLVVTEHDVEKADCAVLIGDRYEIARFALLYREKNVPIAHVHAGDITGQEPDDTYRDVITRLSKWRFCANEKAAKSLMVKGYRFGAYITGSPYISAVASTPAANISDMWPDGDGAKVLIACNPLPENNHETAEISKCLSDVIDRQPNRYVAIEPNTDRNAWMLRHVLGKSCEFYSTVTQDRYYGLLNDADVIIGNTSSGLIENSYYGTPYICIGTRQKGRVGGNHVLWCSHLDAIDKMLEEALGRPKRPNHSYGDINSAMRIASILTEQL